MASKEPTLRKTESFPVKDLKAWYEKFLGSIKFKAELDEQLKIQNFIKRAIELEALYNEVLMVTLPVPDPIFGHLDRESFVKRFSNNAAFRQIIEEAINAYEIKHKPQDNLKLPLVSQGSSVLAERPIKNDKLKFHTKEKFKEQPKDIMRKEVVRDHASGHANDTLINHHKDKLTDQTKEKLKVYSHVINNEKVFTDLKNELDSAARDQTQSHPLAGVTLLPNSTAAKGALLITRKDTSKGEMHDHAEWEINASDGIKTSTINSTAEFQNLIKFALTIGSKKVEMVEYTSQDPSNSRLKILRAMEAFMLADVMLDIGEKNKSLFLETKDNKISAEELELYNVLNSNKSKDYLDFQRKYPTRQSGEVPTSEMQLLPRPPAEIKRGADRADSVPSGPNKGKRS